MYIKAFDGAIEYRKLRGLYDDSRLWKTGEDLCEWWMYSTDKEQNSFIEGQVDMWGDEYDI
jgi:hypothetical protein